MSCFYLSKLKDKIHMECDLKVIKQFNFFNIT